MYAEEDPASRPNNTDGRNENLFIYKIKLLMWQQKNALTKIIEKTQGAQRQTRLI